MKHETFEYVVRISKEDAIEAILHLGDEEDHADVVAKTKALRSLSDHELASVYDFTVSIPAFIGVRIIQNALVSRITTVPSYQWRYHVLSEYMCMLCGETFSVESPDFLEEVSNHTQEEHTEFIIEHPEYGPNDLYIEIDPITHADKKFLEHSAGANLWLPVPTGPVCPQAQPNRYLLYRGGGV